MTAEHFEIPKKDIKDKQSQMTAISSEWQAVKKSAKVMVSFELVVNY